jgi:lipoprotein NlpD
MVEVCADRRRRGPTFHEHQTPIARWNRSLHRRSAGPWFRLVLIAALPLGAGCSGPAAETRGRPARSSLRTDDLPPPRRPPPPAVSLAPAHAEPDLVDERPHPTAAAPVGPGTYRVQKGETLYGIAKAHGTTAAALASSNGIAVEKPLAVGQVLIVPSGGTEPGEGPASPAVDGLGRSAGGSGSLEGSDSSTGPPGHLPSALAAAFDAAERGRSTGADRPSAATTERSGRILDPDSTGAERAPSGTPGRLPERRAGRAPARVESSMLGAFPSGPGLHTASRGAPLHWPLRGVLYARFGRKGKEQHDGIDLAAPVGTPVRTAAEGMVIFAGPQQGYGLLAIVEHAGGLVTVYAHNRDLRVRTGQAVREAQVIATVGESGKTSGPHLHFEVRQDGEPVDPLRYLGPPPSS